MIHSAALTPPAMAKTDGHVATAAAILQHRAANTVCFAGGIVGPLATGWIKDLTGSFAAGLHRAPRCPWSAW